MSDYIQYVEDVERERRTLQNITTSKLTTTFYTQVDATNSVSAGSHS